MVIAICKKRGVKTINVVRRSEAKQELLDLGCACNPYFPAVETCRTPLCLC